MKRKNIVKERAVHKAHKYFYAKQVEYEAMRRMIEQGALLAIRSAGSKTIVDVIGIFPEKREVWLVQVKSQEIDKIGHPSKKFKDLKSLEGDYKIKPFIFAKTKGRYVFLPL